MAEFGVSVTSILPGYIDTNIKTTGTEPMGTPELIKTYQKFWDEYPKKKAKNFETAGSPQLTSDDIRAALTDRYPRTRYHPGPAGALSGEQLGFVTGFLSDRLTDFIKSRT